MVISMIHELDFCNQDRNQNVIFVKLNEESC